jgi:hypothetical protein
VGDGSCISMNEFVKTFYDQAQAWLPTKTMILSGLTISVTANGSTYYKKGSLGGYEPEQVQSVSCETTALASGKEDLTGQQCTIDGAPWRIAKMNIGTSITHIDLISIDED